MLTANLYRGTNNFKKDTLDWHEKTKGHQKATDIYSAKSLPAGQSQAENIIVTLNETVVKRLAILFNNCHALVLANRPFTDYPWMVELDRKKGLDVGNTYLSDKAASTFIHFISEHEKNKIRDEVNKVSFISLISDGSTDCSVKVQEILYVRYAINGEINNKFVGVKSVEKADADHIVGAINDLMCDELDLSPEQWEKKIVGFGSDGARVMLGKNAGVVTKFKAEQPCLQAVHCYAHRLELAYKDAMKAVKLYEKFNQLLITLYYFLSQ